MVSTSVPRVRSVSLSVCLSLGLSGSFGLVRLGFLFTKVGWLLTEQESAPSERNSVPVLDGATSKPWVQEKEEDETVLRNQRFGSATVKAIQRLRKKRLQTARHVWKPFIDGISRWLYTFVTGLDHSFVAVGPERVCWNMACRVVVSDLIAGLVFFQLVREKLLLVLLVVIVIDLAKHFKPVQVGEWEGCNVS